MEKVKWVIKYWINLFEFLKSSFIVMILNLVKFMNLF